MEFSLINLLLVLLAAWVSGAVAVWIEHPSILGVFLAGVFLRGEIVLRTVSDEVTTLVHDLSVGFFAPVYFCQRPISRQLFRVSGFAGTPPPMRRMSTIRRTIA